MKGEVRKVTFRLPPEDYKLINQLVKQGKYLNISDFLRKAVKKQLEKEVSA